MLSKIKSIKEHPEFVECNQALVDYSKTNLRPNMASKQGMNQPLAIRLWISIIGAANLLIFNSRNKGVLEFLDQAGIQFPVLINNVTLDHVFSPFLIGFFLCYTICLMGGYKNSNKIIQQNARHVTLHPRVPFLTQRPAAATPSAAQPTASATAVIHNK